MHISHCTFCNPICVPHRESHPQHAASHVRTTGLNDLCTCDLITPQLASYVFQRCGELYFDCRLTLLKAAFFVDLPNHYEHAVFAC